MASVTTASAEIPASDYPPAPWELRGQAHFHVVAVRASQLPATPAGFSPLLLAG